MLLYMVDVVVVVVVMVVVIALSECCAGARLG